MGGRQEWRGMICVADVWRTDQLYHRGNPEGAESEEVLRLPGSPFRALLRIPQPLEEPKACGKGYQKVLWS